MWDWVRENWQAVPALVASVAAIWAVKEAWWLRAWRTVEFFAQQSDKEVLSEAFDELGKQADSVRDKLPEWEYKIMWGQMMREQIHKDPTVRARAKAWLAEHGESDHSRL